MSKLDIDQRDLHVISFSFCASSGNVLRDIPKIYREPRCV